MKSSQKYPVVAGSNRTPSVKYSVHNSIKASAKNEVIEQESEKFSQHSLKDDINVPSLHSTQRFIDQKSNTNSKAKASVLASSIKQSHPSASGLVFNPVEKSHQSSIRDELYHESAKASELASSRKSNKPRFVA